MITIALVGAFSVIVKTDCETDVSFYSTCINTLSQYQFKRPYKHYDYSVSRNLVDTFKLCIVTVLTTAVQHTISWQTVCNPTCRALGSLETRCKLANYK